MERSSLNKVILIGRVGQKPEGKYTPSGDSVANFSIATTEVWGSDDKRQERTEWHRIVVWRKLADFVTQYIQKGQLISIEGRLRTRSWTDKENVTRKITEIEAITVTPLVWKTNETQQSQPNQTSTINEPEENEEELPF